jgi:hypothetical protein
MSILRIGRTCDQIDGKPPIYARIISFFVVLFPAIDVASAYPLNAYTLGNNLMSYHYGEEMVKYEKSKTHLYFFRALGAIPPIIAACFVSDLGSITDYTGLTGFAIAFVFPAVLARYSARRCDELGIDKHTRFSGYLTSVFFQNLMIVVGVFLIIYVGVSLLSTL